jgi:hypothetical protein
VKVPPVRITLPDGTVVNSEQSDLRQILSKVLKREVQSHMVIRRQLNPHGPICGRPQGRVLARY